MATISSRRRTQPTKPAPRRRNTWRKDPEGRKLRILTAAARLFGERGYDAVSAGEIAAAAGVAEGTLYHHFGCKRGLLCAVAESYGEGFAKAMFAGIAPSNDHPNVEPMVRRAFAYVAHSDPLFALYLLADSPESSLQARKASREAIIDSLVPVFTVWAKRGLVRRGNQRILAELCFGLVESALRQCFSMNHGFDSEEYIVEVSRALSAILHIT